MMPIAFSKIVPYSTPIFCGNYTFRAELYIALRSNPTTGMNPSIRGKGRKLLPGSKHELLRPTFRGKGGILLLNAQSDAGKIAAAQWIESSFFRKTE
jgi:hypothetical protein